MKKIPPASKVFFILPEAHGYLLGIPTDPTTVMIRLSALFCKLFQIKISSEVLYARFAEGFRLDEEECPFCHAKGNFVSFGTYPRYIVDLIDGKPTCHRISVLRFLCKNCSHTHAILPDFIVPYSQYSLTFILRVLYVYFLQSKSVESLCEWAQITPSMLYRWKALFLNHRSLWLSALEQAIALAEDFVVHLADLARPSDFLRAFFRKTGFSFLQSHKNPANSRKPPP